MRYPLLFIFRDRLDVRGDLVEVTVKGRALAVQEAEGWWIYGVTPGDLAECGGTSTDAGAAFRKAFSEVLQDIASSVADISSFKVEVERFFTANEAREAEWRDAVQAVRKGDLNLNDLPREQAESPRGVDVQVIGKKKQPLTFDPGPIAVAA